MAVVTVATAKAWDAPDFSMGREGGEDSPLGGVHLPDYDDNENSMVENDGETGWLGNPRGREEPPFGGFHLPEGNGRHGNGIDMLYRSHEGGTPWADISHGHGSGAFRYEGHTRDPRGVASYLSRIPKMIREGYTCRGQGVASCEEETVSPLQTD